MPTQTTSAAPSSASIPPMINASTSTVRRNLFHAHLSRRPASSASTVSAASTSTITATANNHSFYNTINSSNGSSGIMAGAPSRPASSRLAASSRPASRSHAATKPSSRSNDDVFGGKPTSTSTSTTANSSNSTSTSSEIVPRDPKSGKYYGLSDLPVYPYLPHHQSHDPNDPSSSTHGGDPNDPHYASSNSDPEAADALYTASLREREDKERIEKSLVEMMYRARTRGRNGHTGYAAGLGAEMEEVLDLVRESLRKKVQVLDEEGWMFGEEMDTEAVTSA